MYVYNTCDDNCDVNSCVLKLRSLTYFDRQTSGLSYRWRCLAEPHDLCALAFYFIGNHTQQTSQSNIPSSKKKKPYVILPHSSLLGLYKRFLNQGFLSQMLLKKNILREWLARRRPPGGCVWVTKYCVGRGSVQGGRTCRGECLELRVIIAGV